MKKIKFIMFIFSILVLISFNAVKAQNAEIVYVTSNGSIYHTEDCIETYGQKTHRLKLKDAIFKGYIPCKKCNPYGMNNENSFNYNVWLVIISVTLIILLLYLIYNDRYYLKSHKKKGMKNEKLF